MSAGGPRPLRILLLYETLFPDSMGGVEVRNHELARALAARGHAVTLAGFCNREPAPPPGVRIRSLGPLLDLYSVGRRSARHALRLARAALRVDLSDYDVIESASVPFAHLPPLAARCAARGIPLLVTWYEFWGRHWGNYVPDARALAYQAVERLVARLGTTALYTSELTGGRLRAVRRGHSAPLACGVDAKRIAAAGAHAQPGPPLVFVGRLIEHKRLDLLLRAVARLRPRADAPVLLTVLGDGPDRARFVARVAELGLANRVRHLIRLDDSDAVYAELAGAKIAVQPSAREGFGLFPLEALAAGLPVVHCTSSESAVGEIVRDWTEGFAVAPDPAALAAAIDRLLDDDALRATLGAGARLRAAGYDWSRIAARFEELARATPAARG